MDSMARQPQAEQPNRLPGYQIRELYGHRKKVFSLGWNNNGRRLASGSVDQSVKIWTIDPWAQGKAEKPDVELKGHNESVNHLAWKPTHPDHLVTTSMDKTVRLWDAKTAKCSGVINTTGNNLFVAWTSDGNTVAVSNKENTISFIDVRKCKVLKSHKLNYEVNEIVWGPTDGHLLISTGNGSVEVLSYPSFESVWTLQGHCSSCYCLAMSRDKKYLVTSGGDALVNVWDMENLVCIRSLPRLDSPVRTLSVSHDSKYVALAGEDANLEIMDAMTGDSVLSLLFRTSADVVMWNPVYSVLAYAADEKEGMGGIGILAPPKS